MSRFDRLAAEWARRSKRQAFTPEALCFGPQLALVRSKAKRKVARLPRRGGKTTGAAVLLLDEVRSPPYGNLGYVTISLKNAKRLVWPAIKRLNREYKLGGVANDSEGFMRFPQLPNEPHIYLGGVHNKEEVEKLRGWEGGVKGWVLDEIQAMRQQLLAEAIDDAIEPALIDYDGWILGIGTPGFVRAGYFWEIDQGAQASGWEHHFWTLRDNPHLERKSGKPVKQIIAELLKRRGWTKDNPTFRREYMGEWVDDLDARMFHYDAARNDGAWQSEPQEGWTYVIGFDLGFDDADAIAVMGWAKHERRLHLVEEFVMPKQGVTPIGNALKARWARWNPTRLVGDMGGLGKKIGEELQKQWGLPVTAAEKTRKAEHIELLNDGLRQGLFRAPKASRFAQDCAIMQWDMDSKSKGVLKESPDYHSDICDAVLYAYRACLHWLEQDAPPPPPPPGDALKAARLERAARDAREPWEQRAARRAGFE